jgi:exopolyphosphatase / guanosine-5'-triphosphate,3'-diphosphate pyrophosphatase
LKALEKSAMADSGVPATRVAALDVGSNTVPMLVAELSSAGVRRLADFMKITRLGRGVDRTGLLDPAASALTLDAIAEFVDKARAFGAQKILTAATAALRDAHNGAEFLKQVHQRTGVKLEIISGQTEAQLNFLAATHGLGIDPTEAMLIVDIGGGSTELIRCETGAAPAMVSLQIGSVRLTERFVHHDPPSTDERAQIYDAVREQLRPLRWDSFHPRRLVGVAGTVTTVCAVAIGLQTYDHSAVHGRQLSKTEVTQTAQRLFGLTTTERKALPGMIEGRADVICAGAAILDLITQFFQADTVTVSDQGVRWGLVYRELASA